MEGVRCYGVGLPMILAPEGKHLAGIAEIRQRSDVARGRINTRNPALQLALDQPLANAAIAPSDQ